MVTYTATAVTTERAEHAEGPAWDVRRDELLWVALRGGSKDCRYAPTGEKPATVAVPAAPQVSSCAFHGRTLFITTSQEGYGPAGSARHPGAGLLFAVELPVGGPAATPYAI